MANMLRGMKRDKAQQQGQPQGQQQAPQGQPPKADPVKIEQVKTTSTALIGMAHNPKASKSIHKMLQSGEPKIAIPQAAMAVYTQLKNLSGARGQMPFDIALPAYVILVDDLMDFGNQAGFFNIADEQSASEVLENSFQLFIETGLKDKSIDPIKLQEELGPMLSQAQQMTGMEAAQEAGIPPQASPQMMTEQHSSQRLHQQEQGMLQQRVQQGQQQAPQGQQQAPQGQQRRAR